MQRIDPNIEKPTRDLLAHAMRGELTEMAPLVYAIGDQRYLDCTKLCIMIAGYVGIDVCRNQWPGEADLREIARHTAETTDAFELSASDVFAFLSRVVFGAENLDGVFPDPAILTTLPVLATAEILLSFCPREKGVVGVSRNHRGVHRAGSRPQPGGAASADAPGAHYDCAAVTLHLRT
jgi:hypothetical protein